MWLETAKRVTQLNRSPHLDKVSCTRTLKARYFSYGAAGRVQSQKQAVLQALLSARNRRIPLLTFGTCTCPPAYSSASKDSNSAFSTYFKSFHIFSCLQCYLSPFSCLIFMLSSDWCAQRLWRGAPQQQEDCSMRRHSRTPVNGKALHCSSRSGFRAQPAYLKQPGHLKHQRIPPPPAGQQLLVTADHL